MIAIKHLIRELGKFPGDSYCYAYEGEVFGVIVVSPDGKQLGYVPAREGEQETDVAEFD